MNGSRDTLYYINKHVYRFPLASAGEPEIVIESSYSSDLSGGYYGLAIDPWTGDIYVGDAVDHAQQGRVYRYRKDGSPVDTMLVGVSPGAFAFKAR